MRKKLLRLFLYIIAVIIGLPVLLLIIWFCANLYSPALNPQITALESAHPLPPASENAYFAAKGLNAPVGEDPGTFALKRAAEIVAMEPVFEEYDPEAPERPPTDLEKQIEEEQKQFDGDLEKMACLLKFWGVINEEPCASDAEIEATFAKNKLLLDRYQSLATYPRFTFPAGDIFWMQTPYDPIGLHKMYSASMLYKSTHERGEDAIRDWIESTKFLNMALADEILMVDTAILMVNLNINLKLLPMILNDHPELAKTYAAHITPLLSLPVFGDGSIDLDKSFLADNRMVRMILEMTKNGRRTNVSEFPLGRFFYDENDTLNQLYGFYQYLFKGVSVPPGQSDDGMTEEEAAETIKYQGYGNPNLFYNPIGNLLLDGLYKGQELFGEGQWRRITNMRMIGAYVQALANDITPEAMPAFLTSLSPEWKNPVTGDAFLWDSQTAQIYYERPLNEWEKPDSGGPSIELKVEPMEGSVEIPPDPSIDLVRNTKRYSVSFNKDAEPVLR